MLHACEYNVRLYACEYYKYWSERATNNSWRLISTDVDADPTAAVAVDIIRICVAEQRISLTWPYFDHLQSGHRPNAHVPRLANGIEVCIVFLYYFLGKHRKLKLFLVPSHVLCRNLLACLFRILIGIFPRLQFIRVMPSVGMNI